MFLFKSIAPTSHLYLVCVSEGLGSDVRYMRSLRSCQNPVLPEPGPPVPRSQGLSTAENSCRLLGVVGLNTVKEIFVM